MALKTRKSAQKPPSYYAQRQKELAKAGSTPKPLAATTEKNMMVEFRRVEKYCGECGQDISTFLNHATLAEIKTYFEWTVDRFANITAATTLKNYWRTLRMMLRTKVGRDFSPEEIDDVRNYLTVLLHANRLRIHPLPKPVLDKDAVYQLLHHLWTLDTTVYPDERQRVQVHCGLLMSTFFGCRLASIFDTRVKLESWNPNMEPENTSALFDERISEAMRIPGDSGEEESYDLCGEESFDGIDQENGLAGSEPHGEDDSSDDIHLDDEEWEGLVDDDCLAGNDNTRTFLYRHIALFVIPGEDGMPNTVFMKITQPNTKGQDNNPRVKTLVIDGSMDHPLFCLLDVILALAIDDDAFESEYARNIHNIFRVAIPSHQGGLRIRWKERVLDLPVFRQPTSTGTSPSAPLKASTYAYRLRQLGRLVGFENNLGQKWFRRGLLNVVNRKVPSSVRDQLFDHKLGSAGYYLDRDVLVDTKALFLGRPSDDIVHKMARQVTLTANPNAPRSLTDQQLKKVSEHHKIIQLKRKVRDCSLRIRAEGYPSAEAAKGTTLYDEKVKAENNHRKAKEKLKRLYLDKERKIWFRNADTIAFENHFSSGAVEEAKDHLQDSHNYHLKERADFVTLLSQYELANGSSIEEKLLYRIRSISLLSALCRRQETKRDSIKQCPGPTLQIKSLWDERKETEQDYPMICKPRQCIWCLGDTRKTYAARTFEYTRTNKMLDEADRHLRDYAAEDEVPCPHPACKQVNKVLSNKVHFKSHLARDHLLYLRPCH